MPRHRDFAPQDRLPATWTDAIEELVGNYLSPNFRLERVSASTLRVPVSGDQVGAAVDGKWRWITAHITAAHAGGGAGEYNIYLTAYPNAFSTGVDGFEDDDTIPEFGLKLGASPSGSGAETHSSFIGTYLWDGTTITAVTLLKDKVIEPVRLIETALPVTNLFTGREILFQTAGMLAAGVGPWLLRYNAALAGNSKWKAIAADPWFVEVTTAETFDYPAGYEDLATPGPSITLPAPGEYLATHGSTMSSAAAAVASPIQILKVDTDFLSPVGTKSSDVDELRPVSRTSKFAEVSAGALVIVKYSSVFNDVVFSDRFLTLTPIRLG